MGAAQTSPETQTQTADRDYLTALLEDNLSGAGRQVVITGFQGALSSQARIASLTIADDLGIWISLTDVVLDWTRSDLLRGEITVNTLSAAEIDLARMPQSQSEVVAEAAPFALPQLPVAVSIGNISAQKLRLGASVLGQEITASATASLQLSGGEGKGKLQIQRLDEAAPDGRADVDISFNNAARVLGIDVQIIEAQGGIFAGLVGFPGSPALEFTAKGDGPINDFAAQIDLRSDGATRFGGTVQMTSADAVLDGEGVTAPLSTQFNLDLSGNIVPLLTAQYAPFFGTETALQAKGQTRAAGGFDINALTITSQGLRLSGSLAVAASGVPARFALTGAVQSRDGAPLVLPLALNSPASITSAFVDANFDAALGDAWQMTAKMTGWSQADLRIGQTEITVTGNLRDTPVGADLTGDISFSAESVQPARASLSRAVGSVIWGAGKLAYQGGALSLSQLTLQGEDYKIAVNGKLSALTQGLVFDGDMVADARDFSRFGGLIGHPIAGAGSVRYNGKATLLTQAFDGVLQASARDLAFGIAAVDPILTGQTEIFVKAARTQTGIDIAALKATATGATLDLSGRIAKDAVVMAGDFALLDMPAGVRGFGGQVVGNLALQGTVADAVAVVTAQTQGLDLPLPYVQAIGAADTDFTAEFALKNLSLSLRRANLSSALLAAHISPTVQSGQYSVDVTLKNLGAVLPQFPGALTASGTAIPVGDGAMLDIGITGPAGLSARIDGQVSARQSNDVRLRGRADAGLINAFIAPRSLSGAAAFDLTLRGAASPDGVSGRVEISNARLADPNLPFALNNLDVSAGMAAGQINLTAKANATTGGSLEVTGTLAAAPPHRADLNIGFESLGLRDPDLYQSSASGNLRLTGPLRAGAMLTGAVDLGRTEVQLRPTSLGTGGVLPDLHHTGASQAVLLTQKRAGFDQRSTKNAAMAPIGLDITVRAPNRLFVRGRGLDAELGGEVRLQGSTVDVRPTGAFDLVQGRFEILSKRLDLEEVRLEMQGQLIPFLSVRATNQRGDVTTTVIIDGPVTDPEFRFTSSPELPEEEVLAELLFDQNLQGLSPLQAIQLTGAIATLSGRGDGLIGRIRRALGLDNLDMRTDDTGKTALKLGKYVSDGVYSELSGDSSGQQSLDFTYTLNSKLKLRAGAETTGNASVGLEFETNY